jgi:hypothetical protein
VTAGEHKAIGDGAASAIPSATVAPAPQPLPTRRAAAGGASPLGEQRRLPADGKISEDGP